MQRYSGKRIRPLLSSRAFGRSVRRMSEPFFFGYGSLVNRRTHTYPEAYPARIRGWRRAWRYSRSQQRTFLTAVPDPDCEIDGLLAHVPSGDWTTLDQRETGYLRHPVPDPELVHSAARKLAAQIYAIPSANIVTPAKADPIRLSYLDVVVQGYLREFGPAGAERFFATTDGWDTPVEDDREAPGYQRHQHLATAEQDFVDAQLRRLGVHRIKAPCR